MRVTGIGEDSMLKQIIRLMEDAQMSKVHTYRHRLGRRQAGRQHHPQTTTPATTVETQGSSQPRLPPSIQAGWLAG